MIDAPALCGLNDKSIDFASCEVPVHQELVRPVEELRLKARAAGFELALASGYRSYERQLEIWNAKAEGRRPLLGEQGQLLDAKALSAEECVFAILRWSALPGASRHHWGTDIDVFDAGPTRSDGYRLQLTVEETQPGGVYGAFHQWLDAELAAGERGFFRPYTRLHGGVAPEPWHLSYAPLAGDYQQRLSQEALARLVAGSNMVLKETVLANLDEIFQRFVWVDWQLYPVALR